MHSAEHIYKNTFDQVYRFALSRTPTTEDAQDIVSRVFIKVVEHMEDFAPQAGATERSWVFSILRNELIDFYRRQKHQLPLEAAEERGETPRWNECLDQDKDLHQVMICLEKLPDRQQEMILLKYQADLKNKEIAQLLNLDEKTVSATLSRAVSSLRTHLTSRL